MDSSAQFFPVLSFLGVVVQLGGALALIGLFVMMRHFVLRREYFTAWVTGWAAFAIAIGALVVRYFLAHGMIGTAVDDSHIAIRLLYFIYQLAKGLGFALFVRGTLMYVGGGGAGKNTTKNLWVVALLLAVLSSLASRRGLEEMVIWQAVLAVPALGYCAASFLWLPPARRTAGTLASGVCFGLLAVLWLGYAVAFGIVSKDPVASQIGAMAVLVRFNSYCDVTLNVVLGYAMILVLMEDAQRELRDAQAELSVAHDRLRRAALYDALTDSLNRRAYSEGVGLEMARATFGTAVLADLDNLKQVNDKFGHAAGDQLLRRCADAVRSTLRPYDRLYRWGGDEFLVIVASARVSEVLDRLRQAIDRAEPVDAGEPVRLQVSLGAADFSDSEELEQAIERADRAMYQEKTRRKASLPPSGMIDSRTPASAPAMQ